MLYNHDLAMDARCHESWKRQFSNANAGRDERRLQESTGYKGELCYAYENCQSASYARGLSYESLANEQSGLQFFQKTSKYWERIQTCCSYVWADEFKDTRINGSFDDTKTKCNLIPSMNFIIPVTGAICKYEQMNEPTQCAQVLYRFDTTWKPFSPAYKCCIQFQDFLWDGYTCGGNSETLVAPITSAGASGTSASASGTSVGASGTSVGA